MAQTTSEPEPIDEIPSLLKQIDKDIVAIDTSDCTVACTALKSMLRAVQQVCEIDPGPRCTDARAKVEKARKKVLAACPDCEVARSASKAPGVKPGSSTPQPPQPTHTTKPDGSSQPVARPTTVDEPNSAPPSPAPPASEARSGCATCTVGHGNTSTDTRWLALAFAVVAIRRLRKRD